MGGARDSGRFFFSLMRAAAPAHRRVPRLNLLSLLLIRPLLLAVGLLALVPAGAQQGLSLGAGLSYSSGDYGTGSRTRIVALPFFLKYGHADWTFKATLPYYQVSSDAGVVPGLGAVNRGGARARRTGSVEGWGDPVLSATYAAYQAPTWLLDLTGRVKLPLADASSGLGTGAYDYGGQVDLYKSWGALTVFGGLGYTVFGSPLDNAYNRILGAAYRLNATHTVGVVYDHREALSANLAPLSEMMVYLDRRLDRHWKTQAYLLLGFDAGSPDRGVGVSLSYTP